ncbi:MAG TPA: hypothetical protein VIM52_12980 [Stellaceae bacterium]
MRLDQYLEIGAERLAHRGDIRNREILVLAVDMAAPRAGEWVELGGGEAHRLDLPAALHPLLDRRSPGPAVGVDPHPLARGAAEEVVDRQPGALADDVPRGDLDRAPRRQQLHRAAPDREILEHDLAGMADVEDAAADYMRRHRPDALGDDGLLAGRHIPLAPAIGPVLGLNPAEQQILRALGAEDEALDARDFHRGCPCGEILKSIHSPHSRRKPGPTWQPLECRSMEPGFPHGTSPWAEGPRECG